MALPRPQTLLIAALCVLAVGGTAWYVYSGSSFQAASDRPAVAPIVTDQIPDTSNWRAAFITSSSTPAKLATKESPSAAQKQDADLTATDKLGIEFFTKYLELRQQGLEKDAGAVNSAVSQLISKNLSEIPAPRVYTAAELTVKGSDKAALTAYASALASAFNAYYPKKNEAEIADEAFSSNDMSKLVQMDPVIANYRQLISALLRMNVPSQLVAYHVQLVNGLSVALYNTEALRHVDTDPLRGLAAVGLELKGLEAISTSYSNIQAFLSASGIPTN